MTDHEDPQPEMLDTEDGNIVTALLKAPHRVSDAIAEQQDLCRSALLLLVAAIACHAVFGFATGMFGGIAVALMNVVKAPLVAVASLLLCMPSLYVFACVSGTPLTLAQAVTLGASVAAMVGLLLVALAPVAWLFAMSTNSVPFVVTLTAFIWILAVVFADRFVARLRRNALFAKQGGIRVWFFILVIVTLQMTTCMRPMLTRPEQGWWTGEKKFFLSHFGSTFDFD